MGFNTLVFLHNDDLEYIRKNPQAFVDSMMNKIGTFGFCGDKDSTIRVPLDNGMRPSVGHVAHVDHADYNQLYLVGGNSCKQISGSFFARGPRPDDYQLRLLKDLAENLGYRVSKKPVQKS